MSEATECDGRIVGPPFNSCYHLGWSDRKSARKLEHGGDRRLIDPSLDQADVVPLQPCL